MQKVFLTVAAALLLFFSITLPKGANGDLYVVKEVIITPKGANVAANIGAVNSSPNVWMEKAWVDIHVGIPGKGVMAPIPLNVRATFELVNKSPDKLSLTVGFPVSNSEYPSFRFQWFREMGDPRFFCI